MAVSDSVEPVRELRRRDREPQAGARAGAKAKEVSEHVTSIGVEDVMMVDDAGEVHMCRTSYRWECSCGVAGPWRPREHQATIGASRHREAIARPKRQGEGRAVRAARMVIAGSYVVAAAKEFGISTAAVRRAVRKLGEK